MEEFNNSKRFFDNKDREGWYGIVIFNPKYSPNVGTLLRTAHIFGCNFVATIGDRYLRQRTDTTFTERHLPVFKFDSFEECSETLPSKCSRIAVEIDNQSKSIYKFTHPD